MKKDLIFSEDILNKIKSDIETAHSASDNFLGYESLSAKSGFSPDILENIFKAYKADKSGQLQAQELAE